MPESHDCSEGLKRIVTLKGDCTHIDVTSATGKFRGDIYFIDTDRPDEWLLCIHAKELKKLKDLL